MKSDKCQNVNKVTKRFHEIFRLRFYGWFDIRSHCYILFLLLHIFMQDFFLAMASMSMTMIYLILLRWRLLKLLLWGRLSLELLLLWGRLLKLLLWRRLSLELLWRRLVLKLLRRLLKLLLALELRLLPLELLALELLLLWWRWLLILTGIDTRRRPMLPLSYDKEWPSVEDDPIHDVDVLEKDHSKVHMSITTLSAKMKNLEGRTLESRRSAATAVVTVPSAPVHVSLACPTEPACTYGINQWRLKRATSINRILVLSLCNVWFLCLRFNQTFIVHRFILTSLQNTHSTTL